MPIKWGLRNFILSGIDLQQYIECDAIQAAYFSYKDGNYLGEEVL